LSSALPLSAPVFAQTTSQALLGWREGVLAMKSSHARTTPGHTVDLAAVASIVDQEGK